MRIELLPAAQRDLADLPQAARERVLRGLRTIAEVGTAPPGMPLSADVRGLHKLRFGQYLLVYGLAADGDLVTVLAVGHRSRIYGVVRRRTGGGRSACCVRRLSSRVRAVPFSEELPMPRRGSRRGVKGCD